MGYIYVYELSDEIVIRNDHITRVKDTESWNWMNNNNKKHFG